MNFQKAFFGVFDLNNFYTLKLLRKAVYGWVALNALVLLPVTTLMLDFEKNIKSSGTLASKIIVELDRLVGSSVNTVFFILTLLIVLCLVDIFVRESRITSVVIFALFFIQENICTGMWDGGVNIIHLLLIYLVFATPSGRDGKPHNATSLTNVIDNCVVYAARVQIALVYLCAGLLKVHGDLWSKGIALFYTFSVDQYSHPYLSYVAHNYPSITVIGSYVTLAYQLGFPFLVWHRFARAPLLLVGTFLHVGIALGMGLFGFGLAICVTYCAFSQNHRSERLFFLIYKGKDVLQEFLTKKNRVNLPS